MKLVSFRNEVDTKKRKEPYMIVYQNSIFNAFLQLSKNGLGAYLYFLSLFPQYVNGKPNPAVPKETLHVTEINLNTMARNTHMTVHTLMDALQELKDCGFLAETQNGETLFFEQPDDENIQWIFNRDENQK